MLPIESFAQSHRSVNQYCHAGNVLKPLEFHLSAGNFTDRAPCGDPLMWSLKADVSRAAAMAPSPQNGFFVSWEQVMAFFAMAEEALKAKTAANEVHIMMHPERYFSPVAPRMAIQYCHVPLCRLSDVMLMESKESWSRKEQRTSG